MKRKIVLKNNTVIFTMNISEIKFNNILKILGKDKETIEKIMILSNEKELITELKNELK